ncbi:MAG: tRNA uridine-5-carboxymethylaminomethyl(34) synthesis GTPase MnmE [Hyphomicrobiales bacterium]
MNATIAAIASPAGTGGISIIKISGPQAVAIASILFRSGSAEATHGASGSGFQSHHLNYGHIIDPANGRTIDEVLLSVMKAPQTYTREDIVEINSHGSPAAVRAILELVLQSGARLAEPGEFTRRAFLNGRIDLTQVEAVCDLINARSARALEISAAQMEGALRQEILSVRACCVELLIRIEAAIDFPEDMDEAVDGPALRRELRIGVIEPVRRLIRMYVDGRAIRDGLSVAIVGRANVGKSSLMNRLLGRERTIVTPIPGTTRDAVEDILVIQGVPVSLWDTAGLQEPGGPVECIGMQKTQERAEQADLILFVMEAQQPLSEQDFRIFERIRSKAVVLVFNKIDLLAGAPVVPELPPDWPRDHGVEISALKGIGMEELRTAIIQSAWRGNALDGAGKIMPNLRQKKILERCVEASEAAVNCLDNGGAHELVAIHLKENVDLLDEILGSRIKTDILESIFSRFCIGK